MIIKHIILGLVLAAAAALKEFPLALWKNYHLDAHSLRLSLPHSPLSITLTQRIQQQWTADYRIGDNSILIQFAMGEETLEVVGQGESVAIRGLKAGQKLLLSPSLVAHTQYELLFQKEGRAVDASIPESGEIVVGEADELVYRPKGTQFGSSFGIEKARVLGESEKKLGELFAYYKINQTYVSFGQAMLSRTFSQLCVEQANGLSFFGICYNVHEGKRHAALHRIDVRYSPLTLHRLLPVYTPLALALAEDLFALLEDTLFYSEAEFAEVPEHVELVRGVVGAVKGLGAGRGLLRRVKAVLNGLMNQMLLSDVNALEEEINYRENKKMHPTLVKMLSLKWKARSRKNALSSTYEESFTPDYFYNHAHQHTDICISKVAWLTAAAAEFVLLVKSSGTADDLDALEQASSLYRILQQVTHSDGQAKQGKYYSVNEAEGVRVYAEHPGYESFLHFTYQLTSAFPEEFLGNLSTPAGLASLPHAHPEASPSHDFRSHVHLYFNYKILLEARARLPRQHRALPLVRELLGRARERAVGLWEEGGRVFGWWSGAGRGARERAGLGALALLLLEERDL